MVLNSTLLKYSNGVEFDHTQITDTYENIVFVDFQNHSEIDPHAPRSRFDALTKKRLLTEVNHLRRGYSNGQFDEAVVADVDQNYETMAQENGMPNAVTTTEHEIDYIDVEGRKKRIFRFLGQTAVQVAESGYDYYTTTPALARVSYEVKEAEFSQNELKPGEIHVFGSPKMSEQDADEETAKREHLAHDDAIRISYLSSDGSKRIMQSMLIRDIPLEAWVAMFRDPNNIFGKSINVEDENSALSIMRQFRELTLPMGALKNGVLSIAESLASYITDDENRTKVQNELLKYSSKIGQEEMKTDAKRHGLEWRMFGQELAESLEAGHATSEVKRFIYTNQHNWCEEDLAVLNHYQTESGEYRMNDDIAAICENAFKRLKEIEMSAVYDSERLTEQVGSDAAQKIQTQQRQATHAYVHGVPYELQMHQQPLQHMILGLQYESAERGCSGGSKNSTASAIDGSNELKTLVFGESTESEATDNRETTTKDWKKGVCRIQSCTSRPGETEVGPCKICRKCEDKFNAGKDPTKEPVYIPERSKDKPKKPDILGYVAVKNVKYAA